MSQTEDENELLFSKFDRLNEDVEEKNEQIQDLNSKMQRWVEFFLSKDPYRKVENAVALSERGLSWKIQEMNKNSVLSP